MSEETQRRIEAFWRERPDLLASYRLLLFANHRFTLTEARLLMEEITPKPIDDGLVLHTRNLLMINASTEGEICDS